MPSLVIPNPYGVTASSALEIAQERDLLPVNFGTEEIRQLDQTLRERSVFSARTTNAVYLSELKSRVERFLAGGYKGDMATLRTELKLELARQGYHPERGFPGDAELGIPPAEPGSLQDLGSSRRINLILETQLRLMTGRAQRVAGLDPLALERYPAWELVRTEGRAVPRDWPRRWVESGGILYDGRMIALKSDPVWEIIGSSAYWSDALDVDHPPFCFQSGMGWDQVEEEECQELGVFDDQPVPPTPPAPPTPQDLIPDATVSTEGIEPGILQRILSTLGNILKTAKRITWSAIFGREST